MVRVIEREEGSTRFWLSLTNYLANKFPSAIWSRRLTDGEVEELNRNPYQVIQGKKLVEIGQH